MARAEIALLALCFISLLIPVLCQGTGVAISAEIRQAIVDEHNTARSNVTVPAANMEELVCLN